MPKSWKLIIHFEKCLVFVCLLFFFLQQKMAFVFVVFKAELKLI